MKQNSRFWIIVLAAAVVVVGYFLAKDQPNYPDKIDYQKAARVWNDTSLWSKLDKWRLYCLVDPAPSSELLREPKSLGLKIIAQRRDYFCPFGTMVIKEDGSRYPLTPQVFLNGSLALYQEGNFEKSIEISKKALALKPDYAEAYNNMCAAHNSLREWNKAIAACSKALEINPGFTLAKNNLAWAEKMAASK